MLTKLTLTIDDKVIQKAKKYAHKKNRSISRIVEEYLDIVSDEANSKVPLGQLSSPLTDSLVGVIKDDGRPYKQMLEDALSDRLL